jgi:hypothetical protein
MSHENSLFTRVMAAAAAVTMSLAILVSYVATPHMQVATGILA